MMSVNAPTALLCLQGVRAGCSGPLLSSAAMRSATNLQAWTSTARLQELWVKPNPPSLLCGGVGRPRNGALLRASQVLRPSRSERFI